VFDFVFLMQKQLCYYYHDGNEYCDVLLIIIIIFDVVILRIIRRLHQCSVLIVFKFDTWVIYNSMKILFQIDNVGYYNNDS